MIHKQAAPAAFLLVNIQMRANELILEVNFPEELSVSDAIQQYFIKRGYQLIGEGRDQMAFESPRGTVIKIVGIGDDDREQVVRKYVAYFAANQQNPYYPKIYNTGDFTVGDETYFVYETEYLQYVANEEETLDYLEKLMWAVSVDRANEFMNKNPVPRELNDNELYGLVNTTEDLLQYLGTNINAPLDLHNVENLRRRANGHLVIMDPFSL